MEAPAIVAPTLGEVAGHEGGFRAQQPKRDGGGVHREPLIRDLKDRGFAAGIAVGVAEVDVCVDQARFEAQRAFESDGGLGICALGAVQHAKTVIGHGVARLEQQRLIVVALRSARVAARGQHARKIEVGVGYAVVHGQRLAYELNALGPLAALIEEDAEQM